MRSTLVTGLHARFTRKARQLLTFTFSDGAAMQSTIDRAIATGEGFVFTARSIGRQKDGTTVAEFESSGPSSGGRTVEDRVRLSG